MRSKFKGVALVAAIVISKYLLLEVWEYRTFCHELSRNLSHGIIVKVLSNFRQNSTLTTIIFPLRFFFNFIQLAYNGTFLKHRNYSQPIVHIGRNYIIVLRAAICEISLSIFKL